MGDISALTLIRLKKKIVTMVSISSGLSNINYISFDDIIEIFGKSDPFEFINTFKRKDN